MPRKWSLSRKIHCIFLGIEQDSQQVNINQVTNLLRKQNHYNSHVQIIFYEGKNFSGCHFECSNDCADLMCFLKHCNSIRVESGSFMIYEKPNYNGNQYYLRKGDYPDFHHWMGVNDSVKSCHLIPMVSC